MSNTLTTTLRGVLTISAMTINVVLFFVPIFVLAMIKLVTPIKGWRDAIGAALIFFAEGWISVNKAILASSQDIEWDVRGLEQLRRRDWYLMVSNHQSWVDILVLQSVFNRRVPFLKFFIKHQLVWVPFLGIAWWALDMPFMRRYSREYLERYPEKRGRDLAATRQACEKFRSNPTTVINFVEGTRSTSSKRSDGQSPYRYLMPPRAGGVAFVLGAMGDILHALIDVTIRYDGPVPSMWDLCCGRLRRIVVDVRVMPIESWLTAGDYQADPAFRQRFQEWLSDLWRNKDDRMAGLHAEPDGK
jgi:1-acyl-sn-glycerol-3-phosphate acyltransferase